MRGGRAAEFVAVLILALGTWLGFATAGPPRVVAASAPATAFSAERAERDLQVISATPHAIGSPEHDRLRDYLVDRLRALGLEDVHVQSAIGFNTLDGPIAATVANVLARKRGTGGGPALLLSAHYDAVPRSFGAGDDGAGVAAILETLRALSAGPPLQRDLIVTLVDAEEEGLLGTEAFVSLHPWAKDVGVVLNFDGRGDRGPVYMFQTSPGNAPLIDALARVDGARTNSLTGEVYRHLPSDTDLSIWLHSGFAVGALNFAHVGGYMHYHTPLDNLATLDRRVVQQMGDYALSLTRTLGATDLKHLRTTDEIYFGAPIAGVIHYPASWALIVGVDAFALVLLLIGVGWYRRTITLRGIGHGALALLATLALPTFVTLAGWQLVGLIHPGYREILQRDPYNSSWYLLAAMAFTVAVAVKAQSRAAIRANALEMAIPPMLLLGLLGLVIAVMLPGASYLFCWPLFAATMCASWWRRAETRGRIAPAWLALFAIPALVLWPPLVRDLDVGLTAAVLPFCALLLALMLAMIVLPLRLTGDLHRWIVRAALATGVVALVAAESTASFDDARKRPDSLSYLVDADSAKAWWISFDQGADPWTSLLLGGTPTRSDFAAWRLTPRRNLLLAHESSRPALAASPVQLLGDDSVGGIRRVHLRIAHTGIGQMIAIYTDSSRHIRNMTINGRTLHDGNDDRYSPRYHAGAGGTVLRYFGVPEEGVDVQFSVDGGAAALRVVSGIEGLPAGVGSRPAGIMSKPFVSTDMTLTSWTIRI